MNAATARGIKEDKEGRQGRNRAGSLQSEQPECDQRCWIEYMDECWSFAAKGARVVVINLGPPGRGGAQDEEEGRHGQERQLCRRGRPPWRPSATNG